MCLLYCLAGGALAVLDLPLAAALLAEVAPVEQILLDLFERHAAAGRVFRPRHFGGVEIAAIDWISVKLFEPPDPNVPSGPMPLAMLLDLDGVALVTFLDSGKELDCTLVKCDRLLIASVRTAAALMATAF